MENQQPGQVVQPGSTPPTEGVPSPTQSQNTEPAPAPAPVNEAVATPLPAVEASPAGFPAPAETVVPAEAQSGWYTANADDQPDRQPERPEVPAELQWTGAEFIAHDKGATWFLVLGLVGLVLAAILYVLTKDKITTGIVILTAIAFGFFAARKPRQQVYAITRRGLQVGQKFYSFHDFKSFSTTEENGITSVVFMPLKRFMPPLTIYVSQDVEDAVLDALGSYLPVEHHKADAVDSLLRRIRF